MIISPISTTPVSAWWAAASIAASSGSFRAADLPAQEAVWTLEIAAPTAGQPVAAPFGLVSALPVSAYAAPADTASPAPTVRVSDRGWITEPDDADAPNQSWPSRMIEPPALVFQVPVYPQEARRTEVTAGEVLLANADGAFDALAGDWALPGCAAVVRRGPHRRPRHAASYEVGRIAEMRVARALDGGSRLALTLVSATRDLAVPACPTFGGIGGQDGAASLAGQNMQRLYGRRLNLEPIQVDAARLIYLVGVGPLSAINGVRDRAVDLTPAGNVPTYAALEAAVVADGTYLTCLQTGHIRLGSTPSLVTVGAEGDADPATGGYSATAAGIAIKLLRGPGGLDGARAAPEAFYSWPTGEAGLLVTGGTVADAMERLAAGVGGWWGGDAFGRLYGGYLQAPEEQGPSITLEPWMLAAPPTEERQQTAPWWRARVAYGVLDRVQGGADSAEAVAAALRTYWSQPNQMVTGLNLAAQAAYPAAVDADVLQSVFTGGAAAQTLADRLLSLFGVPRRSWRVSIRSGTAGIAPAMVMPGTIVFLAWPTIRALSQGKSLLVRGLSVRGDRLELNLWG